MSFKDKLKNYFTMDDEYEYVEKAEEPPNKTAGKQAGQNVVSLTSMQQASSKMVLCEPRSYNEAQEVADNVVNRRAVVVNLQRVDNHQAKRIIDFLSGTVYALNGDIQKLGAETFLCTPDNVDVSGTISELFSDEEETGKGW
ncbi:cell division protein SepF [Lentibacillus sediminis]|uniref:cell division protein SepF n=1 Tax=Lentibacillus sediminis TaxID=1940529 RepID=UPI000C1C6151|nr:cell division protein SepF [Lentibacillus sediminis]